MATTWNCTDVMADENNLKKMGSLPRDDEYHSQCQVLRVKKAVVSCSFDC